ncbi:MAG: amidohydrolase family protein, partial [bacterium]|nr:amidohydrolase family protein [bacterium]
LTTTFGLHASFTLTDSTLKHAAESGNKLNSGFHIHLAEDKVDQQVTKKKYRKSVVARLAEFGILGKKTIAAHGVHISESEMKILKATETIIVHNPSSNMNNAVGVAPIPAMLKKRILVGLGTDGLGNDMFTELRAASFIHKLAQKDPRVFPPNRSIQLAIENNRKITARFFSVPVGMLAPGSAADIIIVDYHSPAPITSQNIAAHFVYGMFPTKVDTVFIQGKKVLEQGKMITVDEGTIFAKARTLAKRLWERMEATNPNHLR